MKALRKTMMPAAFVIGALFSAGAAQATFLDISVDVTGGVHTVDIEFCNVDDGSFAACTEDGFALSFAGTPGPATPGEDDSLFVDIGLAPDPTTNLSSFSLDYQIFDFLSSTYSIFSTTSIADILGLSWVVDGNGGVLESFELFTVVDDGTYFTDLDFLLYDFFGNGVLSDFSASAVKECIDFLDPNCDFLEERDASGGGYWDDQWDVPDGTPPLSVPNTLPPGGDVPAPATLGLLGIGLLMLRRKTS